MEAVTEGQQQDSPGPDGDEHENDPRFAAARDAGGGDRGREMLEHAAQGADLSDDEERAGLDWLLGRTEPYVHDIPIDYETPAGMTKLKLEVRSIDTRKIDKLEQKFIGAGGRLDQIGLDLAVVAEAGNALVDSDGNRIELASERFRTVKVRDQGGEMVDRTLAAATDALEHHFRDQLGLLAGAAQEIRRAAGFDPTRVGRAQRRLVEASLG